VLRGDPPNFRLTPLPLIHPRPGSLPLIRRRALQVGLRASAAEPRLCVATSPYGVTRSFGFAAPTCFEVLAYRSWTLSLSLMSSVHSECCPQELTMPALSPTMSQGNIANWQVRARTSLWCPRARITVVKKTL